MKGVYDTTDVFDDNPPNINAVSQALGMRESIVHKVWFKPDDRMIDWLIRYADDRLIFEIGSGSGHLLRMIRTRGYNRIMGIEPMFNYEQYMQICYSQNVDPIHMYPGRVGDSGHIISGTGDRGMILCARPAHNGMVMETIGAMAPGQELLYISLEENYNSNLDLGPYKNEALPVPHEGKGASDERVWSIIKKE